MWSSSVNCSILLNGTFAWDMVINNPCSVILNDVNWCLMRHTVGWDTWMEHIVEKGKPFLSTELYGGHTIQAI